MKATAQSYISLRKYVLSTGRETNFIHFVDVFRISIQKISAENLGVVSASDLRPNRRRVLRDRNFSISSKLGRFLWTEYHGNTSFLPCNNNLFCIAVAHSYM